MTGAGPALRDISDTAAWAAHFRAKENERPDALFRDPFAARLAGGRGEQIVREVPHSGGHPWAWVTRTSLFDQFILRQVREGADLVINLAAGLDARPYRLDLPASLRWVEVDLPGLLAHKERVLTGDLPRCALSRVALDLADLEGRRELLGRLGREAQRALVITEGLLIYLSADEVSELARDLAAVESVRGWVLDLVSPKLLKMLSRRVGRALAQAGARPRFAPAEGPAFFEPHGWRVIEVGSVLKTAARLRRLPPFLQLAALLPEPRWRPGSGVCLLGRT